MPPAPAPPRPRRVTFCKCEEPGRPRYYSEPDVKYFEIDYEFLRELRRIARRNCAKCRRRRLACGRAHSRREHCRLCCRTCSSDEYSLAAKSYSLPASRDSAPSSRERKNSVQSNKSVSFLESSTDEKEPNYTATSFTDDLKKFLLKPSSPRLSLREKFIISFKQELEATKKSPKLKAIKGLWKSY